MAARALLGVARSGAYRPKKPANENDLFSMKRIDQLFTDWPFYSSRRKTLQLRQEGHKINRKRVQRHMLAMEIAALGAKPRTTNPAPGHKISPYLLRDLKIGKPNHDLCAISPICRSAGASSRAILSWRLSNTMDASFCVEALKEALARYGKPKIFNTEQGSEFTSSDFTGALAAAGIKISMDGRGRWMDNVFIARLWRCLKHEDVYLKGYADGRFHQALGNRTPNSNLARGRARCSERPG